MIIQRLTLVLTIPLNEIIYGYNYIKLIISN